MRQRSGFTYCGQAWKKIALWMVLCLAISLATVSSSQASSYYADVFSTLKVENVPSDLFSFNFGDPNTFSAAFGLGNHFALGAASAGNTITAMAHESLAVGECEAPGLAASLGATFQTLTLNNLDLTNPFTANLRATWDWLIAADAPNAGFDLAGSGIFWGVFSDSGLEAGQLALGLVSGGSFSIADAGFQLFDITIPVNSSITLGFVTAAGGFAVCKPVPEPSSLVVLFSSSVGLVGFVLRRRK
jgi:hypothetical protein